MHVYTLDKAVNWARKELHLALVSASLFGASS